jgi:amidase
MMASTITSKSTATVTAMPASPALSTTGASDEAWRLTASEARVLILAGRLTVEEYALSLLRRINERDNAVKAWAYLDPEQVLEQARALDQVPLDKRGPLHGVPIAVKDAIYTKGEFRWLVLI